MKVTRLIIFAVALSAIARTPAFGEWPTKDKSEKAEARAEREQDVYEEAQDALDEHEWRRAADLFLKVAAQHGAHADAALYWRAYAQNKNGNRTDALTTLVELRKAFPSSHYVEDSKQLEVEIRQSAGQNVSPENQDDEDVKLMAVMGLMNSDPDRAMPILENILKSPTQSSKVKDRAMFVLSQSGSLRAAEAMTRIAKDGTHRDLQSRALKYLGIMGGENSRRILADVYGSTNDVNVKRTILKSFMISGDRAHLLSVARGEQNPDLRSEAVRQLGVSGARNELAELYASESSTKVKKSILQAMFIGGSADKLGAIARTEKDPELRIAAIKNLGLTGGAHTSPILRSLYESDSNPDVRRAIINAFFLHGDAKTLADIGRREKDPALRREIVSKLSLMHSKDAEDFLMDVLKDQ
jgi:HEAT repeat protein